MKNSEKGTTPVGTSRIGRRVFNVLIVSALSLAGFTSNFVNRAQSAGLSTTPTILVLGDSLSAEYGIERGSGWVALLGERLRKAGNTHRVVNASISGETTAGGRSRIEGLLKRHSPAVLILELGANDALRGLDLNSTRDNLLSIGTSARAAGASILVLGMQVPPNYGPAYVKQFSDLFVTVANQLKASLVPFWLQSIATDMTKFQRDGIHPTGLAQSLLLDALWPQLKPLLD